MNSDREGRNLSIIVPCFNEEGGVKMSIDNLIQTFPRAEIIVVDDCSTDNSPKIISSFNEITVLNHEFNRGYGASLKTGMIHATRKYIAWFDAGNEHRTADLLGMWGKIRASTDVAVIGARKKSSSGLRPLENLEYVCLLLRLGQI